MFDTIAGIPAHPLFVHLSVVAIPVAAICFIIWVARPAWRTLGTTTTALSIVSVGSAFLSRMSGDALLAAQGISEENPGELGPHLFYANLLTGSVIVMAVLAVGLWFFSRRATDGQKSGLLTALRVLGVIAAIAVIVTCVLTGHAGAAAVWAD